MKKRNQGKEKGFTLIELLVVIAIIAILSTVVMAGLNSARAKSRDAKRISDVKTLTKALDLYFDTCGGYPKLGAGAYVALGAGGLDTTTFDGTCDGSAGQTFGDFMATLPINPPPGGAAYGYCSTDEGAAIGAGTCDAAKNAGYQITFNLEGDTGSLSAGDRVATPAGIL